SENGHPGVCGKYYTHSSLVFFHSGGDLYGHCRKPVLLPACSIQCERIFRAAGYCQYSDKQQRLHDRYVATTHPPPVSPAGPPLTACREYSRRYTDSAPLHVAAPCCLPPH